MLSRFAKVDVMTGGARVWVGFGVCVGVGEMEGVIVGFGFAEAFPPIGGWEIELETAAGSRGSQAVTYESVVEVRWGRLQPRQTKGPSKTLLVLTLLLTKDGPVHRIPCGFKKYVGWKVFLSFGIKVKHF
jgi:hypothetical protein